MTIAIKVTNRCDDVRFLKNMDFEIYINGESDDTLYRMEDGNPKFRKLFSIGKKHGYAIRGKARQEVQKLVNNIFNTNMPFAIAILEDK
jgi:hypothetical protein